MKRFWKRHIQEEPTYHKQPSCGWGLVHALDYHHRRSNPRKMISHHRDEYQMILDSEFSPEDKMFSADADAVEELFAVKEKPSSNAKRSRKSIRRSIKERVKALLAEEFFKQNHNTAQKEGFQLKPRLQRTYSIHHLESLDSEIEKICTDWKHNVIFVPKFEDCAAESSLDEKHEASSEHFKDSGKSVSKEKGDILEILKVDKELFVRHLRDSQKSKENVSCDATGMNIKAKLRKSRSFPVAELSQKYKPSTLENKQKEVWSFPKEDKLRAVKEKDATTECTAKTVVEEPDAQYSTKRTHSRSSSFESLDKYARLFENSNRTGTRLHLSKSLKLAKEYGHGATYYRRVQSLSHADSYYYDINLWVTGDDFTANCSSITAKDSSLGQHSIEEDQNKVIQLNYKENVPLDAVEISKSENNPLVRSDSVQTIAYDAGLKLIKSEDDDGEKMHNIEEQPKRSDFCREPEIMHKSVMESNVCNAEFMLKVGESEISEGLEHRCSHLDELSSSTNSDEQRNNHTPSDSSTVDLGNDETLDKSINSFDHNGFAKRNKNSSDMDYMRHLLDQSGIAMGVSENPWHTYDQPLSPLLFEQVEAGWPHEKDQLTGWPDFNGCWHHMMLFHLVNEMLLEVYDISLPYYPKALSTSCRVRPYPAGERIIDEVSAKVDKYMNLKTEEKQSIECIVAHDLANDSSWMNLQFESECTALEIEDMIFDEILEELLYS